jgi:hypothetical protein
MELKDIECQLAIMQLKRYLGGGALSDDSLRSLQSHLKECESCKQALQTGQLNANPSPAPTQAVVDSKPSKADPAPATPKDAMMQPAIKGLAGLMDKIPGNAKTLVLSIGLAGTLIGMSMIAKNPTSMFGPRANEVLPASTAKPTAVASSVAEKEQEAKPETEMASAAIPEKETPAPTKAETKPEPKAEAKPEVIKEPEPETITPENIVDAPPTATVTEDPKPEPVNSKAAPIKRSTPKRIAPRTKRVSGPIQQRPRTRAQAPKQAPKPKAKPSNSGIRVYDENGTAL